MIVVQSHQRCTQSFHMSQVHRSFQCLAVFSPIDIISLARLSAIAVQRAQLPPAFPGLALKILQQAVVSQRDSNLL